MGPVKSKKGMCSELSKIIYTDSAQLPSDYPKILFPIKLTFFITANLYKLNFSWEFDLTNGLSRDAEGVESLRRSAAAGAPPAGGD